MKLILPRLPGLNEYISAERSNKHAAAGMKRQCEREIRLGAGGSMETETKNEGTG